MSNYEDVYAPDLTEETESTLSGAEQFVMFDSVEGKRAELSTIADYIVANGEIDGSDIPTIVSTIEGNIGTLDTKVGDLTDLDTEDKDNLVDAINEVNSHADTNASDISDVKEDLQDKADQNGVYPELSAGNITGDFHIDTAPYLYRALRDVADHIGGKAWDTLIGGSVAVNQLLKELNSSNWASESGATVSYNDGEATVVSTTTNNGIYQKTSINIISGHRYLLSANIYSENDCTIRFFLNNGLTSDWTISGGSWNYKTEITSGQNNVTALLYVAIRNATGTFKIKNIQLIDLTQYFASDPSIADYAYTLEQGQAGAGIAWLKSYGYIRDGYIPYNVGALQSVLTTGKKVVGFNQWDEEWEVGGIDSTTGWDEEDFNSFRSKNFIPVFPNTAYYIYAGTQYTDGRVAYYDKDKNYLGGYSIGWDNLTVNTTFTTKNNGYFLKFKFGSATYNHDICINLSKPTGTPKNRDYLPYESVSYPLDNIELRGVAKLVNNEIRYDGDVYESNGTVTRRYGIVDLGTLSWNTSWYTAQEGYKIYAYLSGKAVGVNKGLLSTKYVVAGVYDGNMADMTITGNNSNTLIYIRDSSYASAGASALVASLSGQYLIYEKATSTTETADPFTSPQTVYPDGTEEYIDTRTVPIPVGHETKYELDLAEKLKGLPWDLSMLAHIENGTTASQAYAQGKYFVRNNEFCKAKTAIASGATFTLGTNYEVTTVGAELYALA